jgi:hypothetical protein
MTSKHFIVKDTKTILISFMEDFHARTSALQDMERAWRESEAAFIGRSIAWPVKSSPRSYSLKMCQRSSVEEDQPWWSRLPKWGTIVDGVLYPLRPLEPATEEKGFLYLPTIGANEFMGSSKARYRGSPKFRGAKMSEGLRNSENDPIYIHPNFAEVVMGYPIGWSELTHWATAWFQSRRKRHSKR